MISAKAVIKNNQGIHVRPSGVIINEISGISSSITLKAKGMEMSLMSIMDLLALGLQKGEEVEVQLEGDDEENAIEIVVELFERVYDFPPKE